MTWSIIVFARFRDHGHCIDVHSDKPWLSFKVSTFSTYFAIASSFPMPFMLFQASHFATPLGKIIEQILVPGVQ